MSALRRYPSTLADIVRVAIDERGDADTLLAFRDDRFSPISGREAARSIHRIGAGLVRRGIAPGERVALLSWNRAEWILADLGIASVGAVTVPIYPNLPSAQVREILASSGARLVLVENAEQFDKVSRARTGCPAVEGVIAIDRWGLPDDAEDLAALETLGETGLREAPDLWERRAASVRPEHLATLIYTSGTTGRPKGVMLTHGNLCANVEGNLKRLDINPEDLAISFLPLAHVFERSVEYIYLVAGARIAYARSLDLLAEDLLQVSPTLMVTVPRVLEKIRGRVEAVMDRLPAPLRAASRWAVRVGMERGDRLRERRPVGPWLRLRGVVADALVLRRIREQLGGRVRSVISGGAALPPEVGRFFWGAGVPVLEGYGLTETSPVIGVNPLDRCRLGTIGPPLENVEVRLAEDGEILVRGPSVSQGYWEEPELTAEAFRDGWFHTGDLGEFDEEGYIRITGRKKEILVTSGGKNVAPVKVEALLQESPLIERAVVLGDGRPYLVALIFLVAGAAQRMAEEEGLGPLEGRALLGHPKVIDRVRREVERVQADLASYETIKRFHLVEHDLTVDDGLLTPTLKVRRRAVDRAFAETIQELYA